MKCKLLLLCLLFSIGLFGQEYNKVNPVPGESLPVWAQMMYGDHPNIWQVDDLYRIWRQTHPDEKTTYTQYYKKWRHAVDPFISLQGFEKRPTAAETKEFYTRLENLKKKNLLGTSSRGQNQWTNIGPFETFNTNTGPNPFAKSSQANIYCLDQSLSNPDVLYVGTEGSEIFKSTDHGLNWSCVSRAINISAVTAIEINPTNPDIVFAGENTNIWKTEDGGKNWNLVLTDPNMYPNEILINPANDSIVLAATQNGLYRSTDGGTIWTRLLPEPCYDVEWKTDDPTVAFLVRNDPAQLICRFYKSNDSGLTWTLRDNGWFFSDLEGRNDGGAKLAVSKADPNRIYAVLIGEAKTDDAGFIGIYRSDDAGESWTLPNPPAGGPWDETNHPDMATIGHTGGYHQGFYNLGFDVSDTNPDDLLVGFVSLWYSTNGAISFTCFGGYCGNPFNYVHPDCQDIEINGDDVWMTSDGGVEYSNDFFATHYARNRGITGSDFWGFGTGWNDDLFVGGRYHNGNTGWYENWLPGECLSLGGGEASTGYVNPGEGRKTYYSDIGGVILPEEENGYAEYFQIGKTPNESYYDAESGEMEWDPRSWNTFYVTNDNKLWITTDGGKNWDIKHEFGTDITARAMSFEISRSDPKVMYVFQRASYTWDTGLLWKTTDGGDTWNQLPLPPGYARRVVLALSPENENQCWLAYPDGNDNEKIYFTNNRGESWQNLTTSALDGEHITYILAQGGTDGGIYLGTFRTIWFKDNTMADWTPYNDGLPVQISTCILRPFYRDGKIRLGAYGKGIWEAPFAVPSKPLAQPMVNKRLSSCPGDTIEFDDYSMLSHAGATWQWEFPGGEPSTSNVRNPKVIYHQSGKYDVTLTVTNPNGTSTKTIPEMVEIQSPEINELPPLIDFSTTDYFTIVNPDDTITWEPVRLTSCNPAGDTAYYVHNYIYGSYGQDELVLPVNMDLTKAINPSLSFDVAYAPYFDGNYFIDSLLVKLTNNCGKSYHVIFRSGGAELSTTASGIGTDSLYEYEEFSPQNCEEWRHVTLDLSAYAGQYVTISFLNKSGYGNNMYLDNILLEDTPLSIGNPTKTLKFRLHPNPTKDNIELSGESLSDQNIRLQIFSVSGLLMSEQKVNVPSGSWSEYMDLNNFPAGTYLIKVTSDQKVLWTHTLIKL
ncbi:MAG: PKD domain-containing protein [Saprospiraceae bacterium]|uniref:PKD domain-containing protein n=1 Tax=Candidatus Opimibacter skivensis TaxID=2982028 RepID=A0A9D7T2Z0_9BACT|nr:PKD domain-containing protein [Candidatus Opimibacter skivensis]